MIQGYNTIQYSNVLLKATTTVAKMTTLPQNFEPTNNCVICGRGKIARNHIGNKRFRALLKKFAHKYGDASSKVEKSIVVSEIVETVRQAAKPYGGFVKQSCDGKGWVEVGDEMAREKVGSNLRDLLHAQYKSSTKAKLVRRRVEITDEVESLVNNNPQVRMLSKQLFDQMEEINNSSLSDEQQQQSEGKIDRTVTPLNDESYILQLFTQTNCNILRAIKADATLKLHE